MATAATRVVERNRFDMRFCGFRGGAVHFLYVLLHTTGDPASASCVGKEQRALARAVAVRPTNRLPSVARPLLNMLANLNFKIWNG